MGIDIGHFLTEVKKATRGQALPVVDLIAVQTEDPFKVLVATILSARTKDETTAASSKRLFARAQTAEELTELSEEELQKLIYPVGFYKNKAGYLKKLPEALKEFKGVVPETMTELLRLPGVGRKTANLVLSIAFKKPAICVDTHVHRIMNIWGYVETATPLKTEMALREKLPEEFWIPVNSLLVSLGQSICRPVSPRCSECPLEKECPQLGITPRKATLKAKKNTPSYRYISWNVNGIRAVEKKGFIDIVQELNPDVIGLQETKAQPEQLSESLKNIPGYTSYWYSAQRKGYSGVAFYSKHEPLQVIYGIGAEEFDCEGRVITLEFADHYLATIYFPNSADQLKRLDYKLRFNRALLAFFQKLEKEKAVILCGDFNVAHKEIDLKNPKSNVKNAGFTPEERAWMDEFLEAGYTDTFRLFNQDPENYSWWSYRFSARSKNIGWRIDYFCVSENGQKRIVNAEILPEVMGSDHCPVLLDFKQ
ncbi:exodeoxyribonuclease III [Desulfotalea psychrophila]|uniref:Probable exodeoxyribonuclease (ExoA) n=1 Tax=Desulfotalea psychrophila (strain LSv54 / DSM 12343) TaxID=177439 RepID=Q6AKI0_DESPS|nr:exodeoxyribonuclease III [Desulfotalea psychrophila]CAG37145.1 probable exodeoxyribonuclease (ExoA) [Desulfotalea psychrophila LSv54]